LEYKPKYHDGCDSLYQIDADDSKLKMHDTTHWNVLIKELRIVLMKAIPQSAIEFESKRGYKFHLQYQKLEEDAGVIAWDIKITAADVNEEGELVTDGQSGSAGSDRDGSSVHSSAPSGTTGAGTRSDANSSKTY
jgi:hypothetical protein